MKIEYRTLTEKELNTFIDMRIKQLREEGAKAVSYTHLTLPTILRV